ncbi:MAG: ketoacyl-ACP synthase III [Bacteroidales bacterium]|nr:ketoacyl-ACP synthase III [Bacteroidales bacterium]
MGSKIKQIEYYLPEKTITNSDLEEEFHRWDSAKIEKKLGVAKRHIADDNETALDLAFKVSKQVLNNYDKDNIDFLILCTQSPDYYLPTSACILQKKLELSTSVGAFDFNLGCSGFVYGLAIAKGLINSGTAKNILLVMSETYSKHIHPKDLGNRTVFGDAAAAILIEYNEKEHIFNFELGTDGNGMNNLIVPNGALRNPKNPDIQNVTNESGDISNANCLYMNGPEIFNFTIEAVPRAVNNALLKNNTVLDDINYFIFHQANKYIIDFLRKKINIPEEKFFSDMLETGNTVSATIPIGIKKALDSKKIKPGDKVLLCGFGVGYSWGATIIEI